MSDPTENTGEGTIDSQQPTELDMLKERATIMGIQFHPNIGVEKLKAKIAERTAPPEEPVEPTTPQEPIVDPVTEPVEEQLSYVPNGYEHEELKTIETAQRVAREGHVPAKAAPTPQQQRMARVRKAQRLVRVRVTCMNPKKGNMKGDVFSAGNSEVGMLKKYVPFNATDGWHIPQIILTMLQNKKFATYYEQKVNGKPIKRTRLVPEYAIEILPPLTAQEMNELKQRQLMAQGQ